MYFLFVILNAPVVMITSRKLTNNPDITSVSVFYSSYMNASQVLQILNRRHSTTAGFFVVLFIQIWICSLLVLPLVLTIVKTLSLKCFESTRDGLKTKFTTNVFNLWNSNVILCFFFSYIKWTTKTYFGSTLIQSNQLSL